MLTPTYKSLKKNGTTLYVFPGVAEDKNFETQNENYNMFLSHYVLVNIPRQATDKLNFEIFNQNDSSIQPNSFKDQLVESLRNYVANHESTIRNSRINENTFYYDTFETATTTERIFWKWCKKIGIIDFEIADINNDYFGADTKYNNKGVSGNINHFKEYLWKERTNTIYSVIDVNLTGPTPPTQPTPQYTLTPGMQYCTIQVTQGTQLKPGDFILINKTGLDLVSYSTTQSQLKVVGVATTVSGKINDTILIEVPDTLIVADFEPILSLEIYNSYERFVQFISEIAGVNNVQLPDKAYTETYAYISHQHGQTPYCLWNTIDDNNYKPNLEFPILPSQIQQEIQGGENPNNPILTNASNYPGDIWGHFDNNSFKYTTAGGNVLKRMGDYYGNYATSNVAPTLKWPEFHSSKLDGLTMNLNINDYAKAISYIFPIESFSEFSSTSFDNIAPKDFNFNAVLWYYTIEDVTGNNLRSATNLYGVEFLDNSENDISTLKTKIPNVQKLVSNGEQDGNAYTFSLDTNIGIESGTEPQSFDPDKIYTLFGMELYYEALTRLTYFNDQLSTFINSNADLRNRINDLSGLVYNQQSIDSIRLRMNELESLLTVYSTLQIGESDTIIPYLDTSVNPALVRLNSVDKRYGYIYQFDTKEMFTDTINSNSLSKINPVEKTIKILNGKDFLTVINNNDNVIPLQPYDTTIEQDKLKITIEQDLFYKQTVDIIIVPKINTVIGTNTIIEPINDKKLELYINYNNGLTTNKNKLTTINLPVLKYYDGSQTYNEPHVQYNTTPIWKIRNVFYSKSNTSERVFSIIVEEDLINKINPLNKPLLDKFARFYIKNMLLEQNPNSPTNEFFDLSGQYSVYDIFNNPVYMRSNIIDVEIDTPGSGYAINSTFIITNITSANVPECTVDVQVETNSIGEIISVELVRTTGLTHLEYLSNDGLVDIPGGTGKIKVIIKPVTKISFAININTNEDLNILLSNYDNITNINSLSLNVLKNIDKYFYSMPELTFLKAIKIQITRISDVTNVPFNLKEQRYDIKIDTY